MVSGLSEFLETASARLNVHKFPFRVVSPTSSQRSTEGFQGRDDDLNVHVQPLVADHQLVIGAIKVQGRRPRAGTHVDRLQHAPDGKNS